MNQLERIAEFCRQRWSSDFAMQAHCRERQMTAADRLVTMVKVFNELREKPENADRAAALRKVFATCRDRWKFGEDRIRGTNDGMSGRKRIIPP
jgi:hypothetical protein